jgi:hypothetical protein
MTRILHPSFYVIIALSILYHTQLWRVANQRQEAYFELAQGIGSDDWIPNFAAPSTVLKELVEKSTLPQPTQ